MHSPAPVPALPLRLQHAVQPTGRGVALHQNTRVPRLPMPVSGSIAP
jgi:hypothetical protein